MLSIYYEMMLYCLIRWVNEFWRLLPNRVTNATPLGVRPLGGEASGEALGFELEYRGQGLAGCILGGFRILSLFTLTCLDQPCPKLRNDSLD